MPRPAAVITPSILPTFIHRDFIKSDLKYVKRFNETVLTEYQFKTLLVCMVENNLKTVAGKFSVLFSITNKLMLDSLANA